MTVFQISNVSQSPGKFGYAYVDAHESTENYLNHPTLGLLYSVCQLEENRQLFTTIYAKRLFFLVTTSTTRVKFESIGRNDARLLVENCLCQLRRLGQFQDYNKLQAMYQQTFSLKS